MMQTLLKKILPKKIVEAVRTRRKEKRFAKRFSYNNGKPFSKTITTEGITFDIILNPYLHSGVDEVIADEGVWEKAISHKIKSILNDGGVFIDIGANIGYHSLFAAAVMGTKGKVYSFEPQKSVREQFEESVRKNSFTTIETYSEALSDHVGDETLHIREENSGGSTLLTLPDMESFHIESVHEVKLATLDSFISVFESVDLIKIDVEGYEFEVFKGGKSLLEKYHPTIIMEYSPVFYTQDYSSKAEELIEFLENIGYVFYTLEDQALNLREWLRDGENKNSQIDILCKYI